MTRLRSLWERGPQRVVVLLGAVVLALVVVMIVALAGANGDEEDVEATGPTDTTTTTEATTTTTVPETTTTTSPWTPREQEVIDGMEAAMDAFADAAAPPEPNPDLPAIERTHTPERAEATAAAIEALVRNGTALRLPEDSVHSVEVQSVTFDQAAGREVASVDVCVVTDEEEIVVDTGHVLSYTQGVRTYESNYVLHKLDGGWKVDNFEQRDRGEGEVECPFG